MKLFFDNYNHFTLKVKKYKFRVLTCKYGQHHGCHHMMNQTSKQQIPVGNHLFRVVTTRIE